MGLGLELKKILKKRNMSVAELSRRSGISVNTLYTIINRDSSGISASNMFKISEALNLESDEIALLDISLNPEKWEIKLPSPDRQELLNDYQKLNGNGQKEARKRVHELTQITEYTDDKP